MFRVVSSHLFALAALLICSSHLVPNCHKYKILVLWAGLGEFEWTRRIEIACMNLGWECKSCFGGQQFDANEGWALDPTAICNCLDDEIRQFKPDFTISLKECPIHSAAAPNYLALSGDQSKYFTIARDVGNALQYDGILFAAPINEQLKKYFHRVDKPFHGISWYPSCPRNTYCPAHPNQIFFCGFQWDWKRNGAEYRKLFSLLDAKGCFVVYGPPSRWQCALHSCKGILPFDGISICRAIREAGIALVLHSPCHLKIGTPAARIFEAVSSGAVVICDLHPFVVREFGDSVLYIDQERGGEELFHQVYSHFEWILSHPDEAEEMARRAHAIFLDKFTLEDQMLILANLHEEILKSR